jgi:hypothetical protein
MTVGLGSRVTPFTQLARVDRRLPSETELPEKYKPFRG